MTADSRAIQRRYREVEQLYQQLKDAAEAGTVGQITAAAFLFVEASEALRAYERDRNNRISTQLQRHDEELGLYEDGES